MLRRLSSLPNLGRGSSVSLCCQQDTGQVPRHQFSDYQKSLPVMIQIIYQQDISQLVQKQCNGEKQEKELQLRLTAKQLRKKNNFSDKASTYHGNSQWHRQTK